MFRFLLIVALWTATQVVSGCGFTKSPEKSAITKYRATGEEARNSSQVRLKERVCEYWDALLKGDAVRAFEFFEPAARNEANRTRFLNGMRKFQFVGYEVQGMQVEGTEALVKVRRDFKVAPGAIPVALGVLSQTITDKWIKVGGEWYLAHEKPRPPISTPSRP